MCLKSINNNNQLNRFVNTAGAAQERKLQLVWKLWSPDTLGGPGGMRASAELVVALLGKDASEHFMELVFGTTNKEYGLTGAGGWR